MNLIGALKQNEVAVRRHVERKKLLVRDRINLLLDDGSPFLELSQVVSLLFVIGVL